MSIAARVRARVFRLAHRQIGDPSVPANLLVSPRFPDILGEALAELDLLAFSRSRSWVRRSTLMLIAAGAIAVANASATFAADPNASEATAAAEPASNEALLKKLEAMEQRIRLLEGQLKRKTASPPAAAVPSTPASGAQPVGHAASSVPPTATGPATPTAAGGSATPPAPAKTTAASTTPSTGAESADSKGILGLVASPVPGLTIGAYGEVFFGAMQNPAANGQWQHGFDARRFVLLPTYQITDNIIFNAEIEFEHAGSGFDNDDKLHGTAEIEQLWVDFKIVDQFNWRAPGVDLVPIGYINQHHEPTQFYSVFRPEIYNGLVPSTWKAPSTSIYGTIMEGVKYQVMLSASNEDFGDSFDKRTDAKMVAPGPYFPGIDGLNALGFSNPPLGDFQQLSNTMAVSGRLDLAPSFAPGLAASVSAYYSPNTTPRGAHDDFGNPLGRSSLTLFDAELRYRVPNTGLELRGEYVKVIFGNPANLRANNDSDPTDNVGKTMWAWSGEAAYHFQLGTILNSEWEAVPFYRYTRENLQTAGFAGTDANLPTGAGQLQFHSAGIAIFPSPKLVLKATYRKVIDREPGGAKSDSVLGAVGFFF